MHRNHGSLLGHLAHASALPPEPCREPRKCQMGNCCPGGAQPKPPQQLKPQSQPEGGCKQGLGWDPAVGRSPPDVPMEPPCSLRSRAARPRAVHPTWGSRCTTIRLWCLTKEVKACWQCKYKGMVCAVTFWGQNPFLTHCKMCPRPCCIWINPFPCLILISKC